MKGNRKIILILILLLQTMTCRSQVTTNSIKSNNNYKVLLPKIEILIDSAISHNAMIKHREKEVLAKKNDGRRWKNYWTRNFGVRGEGVYGTFNKFSSNESDITNPVNSLATVNQYNYNVGVYFRIPVEDILNQKKREGRAKIEIEQAEDFLEYEKQMIRERVIRVYHELILHQNSLEILTVNLEGSEIQSKMIELEYQNGILELNEYARMKNIITTIKIEYEKGKSRFFTSKLVLENIIGFKLN